VGLINYFIVTVIDIDDNGGYDHVIHKIMINLRLSSGMGFSL